MKENLKSVIFNLKNKSIEEKLNLKNTVETSKVEEAQTEKTSLLLEMGMLTYRKIRENRINDKDFDNICKEILELDKIIYANKLDLEEERKLTCECGNIINTDDKFCSECGNKISTEEKLEDFIVCKHCEYEIDLDSNYCICCGNKV
ncbi:zinc ribbon domain-containing protein [Romboutsia sp.]|uniref:zinc ribbon domain-containing protein n=1 Tax=Romboutsia sp. TaxID=1965302 RepID=UPI003F2ACC67